MGIEALPPPDNLAYCGLNVRSIWAGHMTHPFTLSLTKVYHSLMDTCKIFLAMPQG